MDSGAEKIVSSILSNAQTQTNSIIQEAEKEVAEIIEEGKKRAQTEKNNIIEDAKKQSTMKHQQIISEAKMNARRAELEAREEVIEESFKKAELELKRIASTSSKDYKESLKKIINEASTEIGGGSLMVSLKEGDANKIKESITSIEKDVEAKTGVKTTLEIGENIDTIGGAIVKTEDGDIAVNNTIEARMQRFKKSLRSEVAKVLFK